MWFFILGGENMDIASSIAECKCEPLFDDSVDESGMSKEHTDYVYCGVVYLLYVILYLCICI